MFDIVTYNRERRRLDGERNSGQIGRLLQALQITIEYETLEPGDPRRCMFDGLRWHITTGRTPGLAIAALARMTGREIAPLFGTYACDVPKSKRVIDCADAFMRWIKPHMDAEFDRADAEEQMRRTPISERAPVGLPGGFG